MKKFLILSDLYAAYMSPRKEIIAGTFNKGDIVEIDEERQGWGLLSDHKGWLPLWDAKEIID